MNREQRRKAVRKKATEVIRPNSKKNFVEVGTVELPLSELCHDENLKECDMEVVDLITKRMNWAEQNLVKNDYSKAIIILGCNYLDALCSLRFDITPQDDKAAIRDTMNYVANVTNIFCGMLIDCDDEDYNVSDYSISEKINHAKEQGERDIPFCMIHASYSGWEMPDAEIVDDIYASFVAKHASELLPYLLNTKKSMVEDDEEYIIEVLQMILKKTDELLPEAQVNSFRFTVNM